MARKTIVAGTRGDYVGKFKGSDTWHRIVASSVDEARGKMLKGTRYTAGEVTIKKYKPRKK